MYRSTGPSINAAYTNFMRTSGDVKRSWQEISALGFHCYLFMPACQIWVIQALTQSTRPLHLQLYFCSCTLLDYTLNDGING